MNHIPTSLSDLEIEEWVLHRSAPSGAAADRSPSSEEAPSISTTNAVCGDEDNDNDNGEEMATMTIGALDTLPGETTNEPNGAGPVDNGTDDNVTSTQQITINPETNAFDRLLVDTVTLLVGVPFIFRVPEEAATGTFHISITWAEEIIGDLGDNEFVNEGPGDRMVLHPDSDLNRRGLAAGLKPEVLAWLRDSLAPDVGVFDSSDLEGTDREAIAQLNNDRIWRVYIATERDD